MAGVRRKKSRRKATIKITKGMRKRTKFVQPSAGNKILHENWDKTKTLQQNLKDLGLSYDTNTTIKIPRRKVIKRKDILRQNLLDECDEQEQMDVESNLVKNTAVIQAFEEQSSNETKVERHISPGEAKFLMELINSHGSNYKKMSRDKRNTYQHTSKQLQRKCEAFLRSSHLAKYKKMYPGLLPDNNENMET